MHTDRRETGVGKLGRAVRDGVKEHSRERDQIRRRTLQHHRQRQEHTELVRGHVQNRTDFVHETGTAENRPARQASRDGRVVVTVVVIAVSRVSRTARREERRRQGTLPKRHQAVRDDRGHAEQEHARGLDPGQVDREVPGSAKNHQGHFGRPVEEGRRKR